MNVSVASFSGVVVNADNTVYVDVLGVNDPRGKYKKNDVVVGNLMYTFCADKVSQQLTSLAVYRITNIVRYTTSKIKSLTFLRLNDSSKDTNFPTLPAFICSTESGIDDIPNGLAIGISTDLTETARTYNLLHQPKAFIDTIKVADIVTDTTETDPTKKHHIELKYTPTSKLVQMEINGVSYYENDDFIVDRGNKILYFDTSNDDFSFDDLKESTDMIRVFYECII